MAFGHVRPLVKLILSALLRVVCSSNGFETLMGAPCRCRAKARLVVRGYTDADALAGQLNTASPASTRLGRGCLLSISACLGWCGWSADVATAFLQGLPQQRLWWGKLPLDAVRLLGRDENTRMLLHKPCYSQLDAPKRWHMEAARRLRELGCMGSPPHGSMSMVAI